MMHMKEMQERTSSDANMMDLQPELEWYMRPYLLDFLIEIHSSFGLQPSTLFLAANLIDRYCSRRVVYKKHYQLVGCAALWIAAKYNDPKDRVPNVRELRQMCCNAYDEEMFVQMEGHVLNTLEWTVGHPTTHSFLEAALPARPASKDASAGSLAELASFFCELALFHREFLSFSPSAIAASALALAQHMLSPTTPNPNGDAKIMRLFQQSIPLATTILSRKYASMSSIFTQHSGMSAFPLTPPPQSSARLSASGPASRSELPSGMMTPPLTPCTPTPWN